KRQWWVGDLQHLLSDVRAAEDPQERARNVLEPGLHVNERLQLSSVEPPLEGAPAYRKPRGKVADEKTLHADPPCDQLEEIGWPGGRDRVVVRRNHSAQGDPAVHLHAADGGLENRAADVVEIDVDA